MLMCFSAGIVGGLVFLQRRSLVGEALSHASYPGVVLSIFVASLLFPFSETTIAIFVLGGAFVTAFIGLFVVDQLEKKVQLSSDAALCFVLSMFFGVGILIASRIQVTHALWYRQIQSFLFGQAATMVDAHVYLYGSLALFVCLLFVLLYRRLELLHFDREFAKAVGMNARRIHGILNFLFILALVIGMRSVGVILLSAMLIAPAAAARQWTQRFDRFLTLSGLIGMGSGFLGNVFSVKMGGEKLILPTGPMIVLTATSICVLSLLLAPERGVLPRLIRLWRFQFRCKEENFLKALYKGKSAIPNPLLHFSMQAKGWIRGGALTMVGNQEAEKLIRLHRLWEVYLVHMGQPSDRVHRSAEEMEHILTPEIETELNALLGNPQEDPHAQPIPRRGDS